MHIPKESVHVLRVCCTNTHCKAVLCFPHAWQQHVITQLPALIRETCYWIYQADSTHIPPGARELVKLPVGRAPERSHPQAEDRA